MFNEINVQDNDGTVHLIFKAIHNNHPGVDLHVRLHIEADAERLVYPVLDHSNSDDNALLEGSMEMTRPLATLVGWTPEHPEKSVYWIRVYKYQYSRKNSRVIVTSFGSWERAN